MNEDIYKKYYGQLVGYKITEVIVEEDEVFGGDVPFVAFILTKKGKDPLIAHLMSDEEGNGTGHLAIAVYEEN